MDYKNSITGTEYKQQRKETMHKTNMYTEIQIAKVQK